MRKLLLGTTLPLLAVCLSLHGVQASQIGVPVPKPTAAGQSITSSPTAPFTWTPVTLPYGMNGTGQMAVGGTVDATTRLSVNPQGTSENGLTVNMPSGATGNGLVVKYGTNTQFSVNNSGTVSCNYLSMPNTLISGNGGSITNGAWTFNSGLGIVSYNTALVQLSVKAASGQTADLLDLNDSTNAVRAKVDKNFVMTAKGFASSVRVVTAADTATLTDSVLLCNGTFTETLPATGYPTGYRLTVKDTGTGTITLTAGGTVTFDGATTVTFATQYKSRVFLFDGVNFQIESGLL